MKLLFKKPSGLRRRPFRRPAVKRQSLGPLLVATALLSVAGVVHAQSTYDNNGTIWFSKYILVNSQWGRGSLSSSQYSQQIWRTNDQSFGWNWSCPTSGDDRVKGYPNVACGYLWNGQWSTNGGFPVQLSWNKNIWTDFGFNLNGDLNGKFNCAYDIWCYDNGNQYPGDYRAEIMIWPVSYWCGPAGTKVANVNLEGANWDVFYWRANNVNGDGKSWDYYAFQKTGSWITDKSSMNLKSFTDYLRYSIPSSPKLNSNWWIGSVGFGSEPKLGHGSVNMYKWRCDIQW